MDEMHEPCQPIGCDNDYHLPGCYYGEVARLDKLAIPRCAEWREANPEVILPDNHLPGCQSGEIERLNKLHFTAPAPYCCSAYCPRCIGLRALDGEPPLEPNEWMNHG